MGNSRSSNSSRSRSSLPPINSEPFLSQRPSSAQQRPPSTQSHNPVRCPRCRRLLQPPPGHARFLCPCGQMLMAPPSQQQVQQQQVQPQVQRIPPQVQQQVQHVRCPSCSATLAPPPGAPIFRCPCGTHLRAPSAGFNQRAQVSDGPVASPNRTLVDSSLASGGEMMARMLHKRADEMWLRSVSADNKYLLFQMSISDHHERRMFAAETKCLCEFEELVDGMDMLELYQVLENLNLDTSRCVEKEDLVELLKDAPNQLESEPLDSLKRRLDLVKVGYEELERKEEFVQRVMTFQTSPFLYDLGHLRSIRPDKSLTWIPARNYALDPSKGQCPVVPTVLAQMSNQPFQTKLTWFRDQMKTMRIKWEDGKVQIKVRRSHLLRDSFTNYSKLSANDLHRYFRFEFIGEPGIDAGGVAREWFQLVTDQVFNADFGLFEYSGVDNVCYQINPSSGIANELHLKYFHFLGRVMGKALFDGHVIAAHMTQPIYKHLLGFPITEKDVEFVDAQIFKSMADIRAVENVEQLYLDFTTAVTVFGEVHTVELKEKGQEIDVTNRNRDEYLSLLVKHILFDRLSPQLAQLLQGFYEVIPEHLLSVFNHLELELLLCGLPTIDVGDWKTNTCYRGAYEMKGRPMHKVVAWFWEFLASLSEEQKAKFLQFATGTSRVPVQGFSALQGNDGNIKLFTIEPVDFKKAVFPKAHTCFNRIELPIYPDKATLAKYILQALQMEIVGFGAE